MSPESPQTPSPLATGDSAGVVGLIARWEAARQAGQTLRIEELCQEQPDCLDDVRAGLRKLGYLSDDGFDLQATTKSESPAQVQTADESPPGTTKPQSTEVPRAIGPYRVLSVLGEGGMGTVYAAEDPALARRVAVKMMKPMVAASTVARDRFLREARSAAALSHDFIVPIHHVGEHEGQPYIVMPLLTGESLETRLRRGPLSLMDFVQLGRQAAEGLAVAHAAGLIHRDIKPGNMWLERLAQGKWRVKLLDFGLARAVTGNDQVTHAGTLVGSPPYMSPEQADGRPIDVRSDLFSLGVVLYEAATAISPFQRGTLTATLRAVAEDQPPTLNDITPDFPAGFADLVSRMLEKEMPRRPTSANAVAAAFASSPGMQETAPFQQSSPLTTRQKGGRRYAAISIVLLALALAASFALLRDREDGNSGPPGQVATSTEMVASPRSEKPRFAGSIDFKVIRTDAEGNDRLVNLKDSRALPLRNGDGCSIEVTIDPPAYVYLFWIDAKGVAAPLYPWKPDEWGTRPAEERKTQGKLDLFSHFGSQYFTVRGDESGLESLLLLLNYSAPFPEEAIVRPWFAGLPPQPLLPERPRARLWFENFRLADEGVGALRGPDWSGDPVKSRPYQLQTILANRIKADYSVSVSMTKRAK